MSHMLCFGFHVAAHVSFSAGSAPQLAKVNVDGTRETLKFVKLAQASLRYFSTSYLSGRSRGLIPERIIRTKFLWKNYYERSKQMAETLVHEFCCAEQISYCVFRPSIVTGDTKSGMALCFKGLYTFMKLFDSLTKKVAAPKVCFEASSHATINLIPIDILIDCVWKLSAKSSNTGVIYNLCNPKPPTLDDLRTIFLNLFAVPTEFARKGSLSRSSDRMTVLVQKAIGKYNPYLFGEAQFDMTNAIGEIPNYQEDFPILDQSYFSTILDFARTAQWGNKSASKPVPNSIKKSSYVSSYFEDFLPERLNQLLVHNLKSLQASVAITFSDVAYPGQKIVIENGMLKSVSTDIATVEATFSLDSMTFERICKAEIMPQSAFFDGLIDIDGDIEKGLQVATALAEFFATYPCTMEGLSI